MLSESGGMLRGALMGGLTSAISNWGSNSLNTGLEGKGMEYDGALNSGDIWNMPSDYDPLAGFDL